MREVRCVGATASRIAACRSGSPSPRRIAGRISQVAGATALDAEPCKRPNRIVVQPVSASVFRRLEASSVFDGVMSLRTRHRAISVHLASAQLLLVLVCAALEFRLTVRAAQRYPSACAPCSSTACTSCSPLAFRRHTWGKSTMTSSSPGARSAAAR